MREEPAADDRLGEPRALLARRGGGKIAQPGEALQLLGQRLRGADRAKVEVLERQGLTAQRVSAGEQGVTADAFAADVVARNGDELQRLFRRPQPRQEGAAGEFADDGALGIRVPARLRTAHSPPRSALMLSA